MKSNLSTPVVVVILVAVVAAVVGLGWYFTAREPPLRLRPGLTAGNAGKGGANAPMPTANIGDVSK